MSTNIPDIEREQKIQSPSVPIMAVPGIIERGAEGSGLNPDVLRRVAALELPEAMTSPLPATTLPSESFGAIQIPDAAALFLPADVELFGRLFHSHILSNCICLNDLFGLEFFSLLEELQGSLRRSEHRALVKQWANIYFRGYLGLLRDSPSELYPKMSTASSQIFLTRIACIKELRAFSSYLSTLLESTARRDRSGKVVALQQSWNETQALLEKCLIFRKATHLLAEVPLKRCPGSHVMLPHLETDIPAALAQARLYSALIEASVEESPLAVSRLFSRLTADLGRLSMEQRHVNAPRILLQVVSGIQQAYEEIEQIKTEIVLAREGSITHADWFRVNKVRRGKLLDQPEFIEFLTERLLQGTLTLSWLNDLKAIIEHSILADTGFHSSDVYANRTFLNLQQLLNWISSHQDAAGSSPLDAALTPIAERIKKQISDRDFLQTTADLFEKNQQFGFSVLMYPDFEEIHRMLEPLADQAQKSLFSIPTAVCNGEPMLDKTIFLSRVLVLCHDLGAILGKAQEEEALPAQFLEFLFPEQLQAEGEGKVEEMQAAPPPALPQASAPPPPAPSAAAVLGPPAAARVNAPPKAPVQAQAVESVVDASEILQVRKRRQVEGRF